MRVCLRGLSRPYHMPDEGGKLEAVSNWTKWITDKNNRGLLNQNNWSRGCSITATDDWLKRPNRVPVLSNANVAITCCSFVPIKNTTCPTIIHEPLESLATAIEKARHNRLSKLVPKARRRRITYKDREERCPEIQFRAIHIQHPKH